MRVVSARITGYGRILEGKINLDGKVIAVVGPNEAGKTTLLQALAFLTEGNALPLTRRSRAGSVDNDSTVIAVNCVLDDADRAVVEDLDLAQPPTTIVLSRHADGKHTFVSIVPVPKKDPTSLQVAVAELENLVTNVPWEELLADAASLEDHDSSDDADELTVRTLRPRLQTMVQQLSTAVSLQSPEVDADVIEELGELSEGMGGIIESPALTDTLRACKIWFDRKDPGPEARARLLKRAPSFLFFDDEDRTLSSTYELNAQLVSETPAALANLAQLAELRLDQLWNAVSTGDRGARSTLLLSANQTLETKFTSAWRQSKLTIHLEMDSTVLSILIKENDRTITVFEERSAGLRMFVALLAFVATRESFIPPVLLIDEAENHLHFDAQADLVNIFMVQEQAAKIIYTTHSPACLPPDLGTSIRAVIPSAQNAQTSNIHNSFWHGSVGFSPLLLAMGAGAAAFSQARYVVLAEGPSEMILLPSLIRAANNLDSLEYQIAPGLAEVPKRLYPDLDLEAARVAYLVDSDQGGKKLRSRLIKGGIPDHLIVELGVATLENMLDPEKYSAAVLALLAESNGGKIPLHFPDLAVETLAWPTIVEKWASRNHCKMPSKVAVATRLIETRTAVPGAGSLDAAIALHHQIRHVLKIK